MQNPSLPVSQLESLRFKANQIIESIQALQQTLEVQNLPYMHPWPEILSKYNIILSQTHNFSNSLVSPILSQTSALVNSSGSNNPYANVALLPSKSIPDIQLDNDVIPLLRNQQTNDVLAMENSTVRRLSEHMPVTRGSLGVLSTNMPANSQKKPEYEDVLAECKSIREEHDNRADRAVRAVAMLKEKYDWKGRVEVEIEEPEQLDWDPRLGPAPSHSVTADADVGMSSPDDDDGDEDDDDDDEDDDGEGENASDEDEVEGALQASTPMQGVEDATSSPAS